MALSAQNSSVLRSEGPRDGAIRNELRRPAGFVDDGWHVASGDQAASDARRLRNVTVDASGIDYCDGSGIALISALTQLANRARRKLDITGLQPEFAALLEGATPAIR